MFMKKNSIFRKALAYNLLLFLMITVIIHLSIYIGLPKLYFDRKESQLKSDTQKIAQYVRSHNHTETLQFLNEYAINSNYSIQYMSQKETYHLPTFTRYPMSVETGGDTEDISLDLANIQTGQDVLIERQSMTNGDNQPITFNVIGSASPIDEAKATILNLFPYTLTISVLTSIVIAYVYGRMITKPIKDIQKSTKRMELLEEGISIPIKDDDEIGQLAFSINQLYEHLLQTITQLEEEVAFVRKLEKEKIDFFRGASHKLKTPLARVSILLENMRYNVGKYKDKEKYLMVCQEEIVHLTEMVNELLMNTDFSYDEKQRINVKDIILQQVENLELLARNRQLTFDLQLEDISIFTNQKSIEKVIENLLQNAVKYSELNTTIFIKLQKDRFVIQNKSKGLTEEDMAQFFQPFYSTNQQSTGLGLYLVSTLLLRLNLEFDMRVSGDTVSFVILFNE
ncbi:HAMP domain-containing sensor histidine kinase [Streptococcus merionis]|uniref:HAMP domain-containing sensor histidine kinase n=1 Tax=Streptococcus merionis TaxID=400065 RepID=UPI0035152F49